MKNNPIGIIDSGLGGVGILKEIIKLLPSESIIYFADCKRAPYGNKTEEDIKNISLDIARYLIKKHSIKALVIACNTATVSAVETLRQKLHNIPIVGVVPVIKPASIKSKNKEIACLATTRTVESKTHQKLITAFALSNKVKVHNIACPGIVEIIEQGLSNNKKLKNKLSEYIKPLKKTNVDTLVLGCTHYTLIEDQIKSLLNPNIIVMNSNKAIATQLKKVLKNNLRINKTNTLCHFVVNGNIEHFAMLVKQFLGIDFSLSEYSEN